jgi:copper/silver efflux system protein
LIGMWAYHFPKIGVSFMPALDEGTTLDMPITVPRASITESADDLKARDALLRGFPEVESVIGKAGRADTPTDPAPLDMVETFVNFRPKELWPKRVLRYKDAAAQTTRVLARLESDGFVLRPDVVLAQRRFADESLDEIRSFLNWLPISGGVAEQFVSEIQRRVEKSIVNGVVVIPPDPQFSAELINNAAQKALERFDETMRLLAMRLYSDTQRDLGPQLVRYAIEQLVQKMSESGDLKWPRGMDEKAEIDKLTEKLTPKYARWLSQSPSPEDITQLSQDIAKELADMGAISNIVGSLELKQSAVGDFFSGLGEFFGATRKTLASELLDSVRNEQTTLWQQQVGKINWELFDRGTETFTWYALEELAKAAQKSSLLAGAKQGAETERFTSAAVQAQLDHPINEADFKPFATLRAELEKPFRDHVFLWPRTSGPKGDLVDDEMNLRVLQVPGWSNIFTQPIINRIDMLSTGVRTDIGVKVFGDDLDTIDQVCKEVEKALQPINGARDVVAAPIMGKGYVQIDIKRPEAARYGISIEDIQDEIEVALAGRAVTYTVEKRDRFPVRVRYARADRNDEDSIRRLLITPGSAMSTGSRSMSAGSSEGSGETSESMNVSGSTGHAASPAHAIKGKPFIPLSTVADIKIVEGPAMIKSENGRLLNYVTLNVRGRDIVGFVDEAQRVVAEKVHLPEGVHLEWSGEFEHQVRAARTLRFVFPAVIVLIFVILYLTYNDLADAGLMMLAVPEALAGGAFFMYLFPKIINGWSAPPMDFSVAVWVGFIACFGMATETGIIMLVYLREAIEKRGGLENIKSLEELRQAVIEGAVHRLRPKLLTEGVAIIAIFPMVFATGVGGEILAPMALPVLGGLLISDEVVDLFLPVRFYWVRRARWLKLHAKQTLLTDHSTAGAPATPEALAV